MFHMAKSWFVVVASLLVVGRVSAVPCVGFDTNSALYVFGLGQDVSLGPSSGWSANPLQATTLTTTGRPPFDGPNTQCFFSQYQNALYVLNADTTQPSNLHIYNYDSQSWTTQKIDAAGTDPNSLNAVLDRDTNVFFALSNSAIFSLDMGSLTQADGTTRPWVGVQSPAFAQNGAYPKPVMALAENHIHFLDTGNAAQVDIFVIHFSFMQPNPQTFAPLEAGGSGFPSTTGQTASIFKGLDSVQQKFTFIPDDGSVTYIFDAIANTTQAMPGPIDKSTGRLAASPREIVQITKSGDVYWIPFNPDDAGPNYSATWSKLQMSIAPAASPVSPTDPSTVTSPTSRPAQTTTGIATGIVVNDSSTSRTSTNGGSPTHGHISLLVTALGLGICGLWSIM